MSSESKNSKTGDNSDSKRKRSETSSASEIDTSINSEPVDPSKVKKKKAKIVSLTRIVSLQMLISISRPS